MLENTEQRILSRKFDDYDITRRQNIKERIRCNASQILAALATNVVKFSIGTFLGLTSVLVAEFHKENAEINVSLSELSWFSSYCFVMPFASLLTGFTSQIIGSRITMLMSVVTFSISLVIFFYSTNATMLLCAQSFTGLFLTIGVGPGATYVIEIAQPHLRGALMASTNFSVIIGAFVTVSMSSILHWKTIVLINMIFPILGFLAVYVIPESPYWLASRGRYHEAEAALTWLRGWTTSEKVASEFLSMKQCHKNTSSDSNSSPTENNPITQNEKTGFKNLEPYLKRSFYLPLASIVYMFMLHICMGYSAMNTFYIIIFKMMDAPIDPSVAGAIFDGLRILGAASCIISIHFTGKRKLMFFSLISSGLIYISIAIILYLRTCGKIISPWTTAILMIASTFFTSAGIDKIVFMLNAELFPMKLRNVGTGIGVFVSTISSACMNKIFLYLVEVITLPGIFLLFGTTSFLGLVTFYFIFPETEGRSLNDIEEFYSIEKNSSK